MKSTSSVKASVKSVSPEYARQLLETNKTEQRNIDYGNVDFLAKQMDDDNWEVTNDAIGISKTGKLINGQHRMHAVIKHGKPVDMLFAEGLEEDAFEVMDTGKNRTASDILTIKGFTNSNKLSSAVRCILMYQAGQYNASSTNRAQKITNKKIIEFIEQNPEIDEVITFVRGVYKQFPWIPQAQLAMLYWVLSKKHQATCDVFFEKYATGADLPRTSTILMLRERLLRDSQNRTPLRMREKMALFIMAWNHHRQGSRINNLMLAKNYVFPKPV